MSDKTTKNIDVNDASQVLGNAFNPVDNSLTTGSFLVGVVGRQVVRTDTSAPNLGSGVAGDDFAYYEGALALYTIRILYSDLAKNTLLSATRVA